MSKSVTTLIQIASMLTACSTIYTANAEDADSRTVAMIVKQHIVTFSAKGGVTIWLPNGDTFSTEVALSKHADGEYEKVSELALRLDPHPSPAPSPHPPPPTHDGGHPQIPIAPAPPGSRKLNLGHERIAELAKRQVIVGRLHTTHLAFGTETLHGDYTIVVMEYRGQPIFTLVNEDGQFVVSSENIVLMMCNEPR